MKIALVCPRYWPHRGGVERYVEEIATRLAKDSEVEVITTDPYGGLPTYEQVQGVSVRRFKAWAPNDSIYHSIAMYRYLRKHSADYDIVHANSYHALPAFYSAETKTSNKLVFTPHFHGTVGHSKLRTLLHIPYRILGARVFAKSDRIIYCTKFEKNKIIESFRIPSFKLVRIEEGINQFALMPRARSKMKKTILCISRLEKYKHIDLTIAALPFLPKEFNLLCVGTGPYASKLRKLVDELGVQDRVQFIADVPEDRLNEIYGEADVAVLMSEREKYSYFIGEALSAGVPCVVGTGSGLEEWADGDSCVAIDESSNPAILSEAIQRMIGRKVKRSVPSWEDYMPALIQLYNDMLCEHVHGSS